MNRTEHIVVHGRVQGVGFRAWAQRQAQLHGLAGWVRNRRDGAVEAVVSGPEEAVAAMLEACAHGPRGAMVSQVEHLTNKDPVSVPGRFEVRGTI